jgi:adenine-specific DNA-methyltransferase
VNTRTLGQVETPPLVAEFLTRWACAAQPGRILDPALGRGVFVDCLNALWREGHLPRGARVTACEIDARMIAAFRAQRNGRTKPTVDVRGGDFLRARFDGPFDAVVCNPPYVRHHEARRDERTFARFDRLVGARVSRMTNLYGLFLLRIWELLGRDGRAAVITPAEWLNADFGVAIKAYLLRENAIDALIQFDPAAAVFDGVLTTAAITLLRRGRRKDEPMLLCPVQSESALLEGMSGRALQPDELNPAEKWSPLFATRPRRMHEGAPLSQYASCARGIATGANGYFVLRPSELREAGIDRRDVVVCISKARQVRGERLAADDVQRLIAADDRVFLLSPREPLRTAVRRYLERGRRLGIDRRYLPSHRPTWYQPERRAPAAIWVNVFARGGFRFVLNEACVLHLTCFHGISPRPGVDARRLHARLCAIRSQRSVRDQQRLYADGLTKLEPRDVERIRLPLPRD